MPPDAQTALTFTGPRVLGSAAHLASVLAGRPCALDRLTGDGVAVLSARL